MAQLLGRLTSSGMKFDDAFLQHNFGRFSLVSRREAVQLISSLTSLEVYENSDVQTGSAITDETRPRGC